MSSNGYFEIEDEDIVRLGHPGGDLELARSGWVNVGAFAIRIETDDDGNLSLGVYACGNEREDLALVTVTKRAALAAGATDLDDNGEGEEE